MNHIKHQQDLCFNALLMNGAVLVKPTEPETTAGHLQLPAEFDCMKSSRSIFPSVDPIQASRSETHLPGKQETLWDRKTRISGRLSVFDLMGGGRAGMLTRLQSDEDADRQSESETPGKTKILL